MSNNLGRVLVTQNQAGKEVTINDADGRNDAALTELFTADGTSGNITITDAQFQQCMGIVVTNITTARDLALPRTVKKLLHMRSATANTKVVTIKINTVEVARLYPGEQKIFQTDGADGLVEVGPKAVVAILSETADFTLDLKHANKYIRVNSASNVNISVNTSVFKEGDVFTFRQVGVGKVVFIGTATISGVAGYEKNTDTQGATCSLVAVSASAFDLSGMLEVT